MTTRTRQVGDLVPSTALRAVGGTTVRLRWPPHGTVLLVVVRDAGAADADGLSALEADAGRLDTWDARAAVVVDGAAETLAANVATPIVDDAAGRVTRRLCLPDAGRCTGVVIDRFGQLWQIAGADRPAGLAIDELLTTIRFVAVQCPECEVPDVPPAGLARPVA